METEDKERILIKLRELGKLELALEIEKLWDKTSESYSKEVNTYSPQIEMEPILKIAFTAELKRVGHNDIEIEQIIESLDKNRIIQTAPHLVPSSGPRMFFIDWLSSLSLDQARYYVVGMYSGIPFSNSFYPGCLSFKKDGREETR